jgi:hypothetical protein
MYVTEHLPGSTYATGDDSMRGFGDASKKRNTTDANLEQRKKRHQSVERNGQQQPKGEYLSLKVSDQHQYQNYKSRKRLLPPQLQDSEEMTQDGEGIIGEDKQSIIKRIIKVKQEIDTEHNRMKQPELIPRGLEPVH